MVGQIFTLYESISLHSFNIFCSSGCSQSIFSHSFLSASVYQLGYNGCAHPAACSNHVTPARAASSAVTLEELNRSQLTSKLLLLASLATPSITSSPNQPYIFINFTPPP